MFTTFDVIVIAVVGLSAMFALFRGFFKEVLSLFAWVVSFAVAVAYMPKLTPQVASYVDNPLGAKAAAAGGLFFTVLILLSVINMYILKGLSQINIGPLDKSLGFAFGALRGIFFIAIFHLGVTRIMPEFSENPPQWFTNSQTKHLVEMASGTLTEIVPEYVAELDGVRPNIEGAVVTGQGQLESMKASVVQNIVRQALDTSNLAKLSEKDKETLRKVIQAVPTNELMSRSVEMAEMDDKERVRAFYTIVSSFETSPQARSAAIQPTDVNHLKQSLASMGGVAVSANTAPKPAGPANDKDAFNKLMNLYSKPTP